MFGAENVKGNSGSDDSDDSMRYITINDELLLLEHGTTGWVPAVQTMEQWRTQQIRLYSVPTGVLTLPDGRVWTPLTRRRELEAVMEHPWIPLTAVIGSGGEGYGLDPHGLDALYACSEHPWRDESFAQQTWLGVTHPCPLPKHVVTALLRDAETQGSVCPITLAPIRAATGVVTSCGHVFQADALRAWLADNETCPECRENCCESGGSL